MSIANEASTAAVLAAGLKTRQTASDATLAALDLFAPPAPESTTFATNSKACDARVVFHRDPRARTIWLVIDRDNAPLTGNYVLEVDSTTSTYNATSSAPADVDALLAGWAAQLTSDFASFTVSVVSTTAGGTNNAIQVTGDETTGGYSTFAVKTATAAPAAAALEILREVDSASLRIWTKTGSLVLTQAESMHPLRNAQGTGWSLAADLGALDYGGYDQRLDVASRSAVWLQLHTPVHTDTVVTTGSGAGVYTLTNFVTAYAAPEEEA